MHAKNYQKLVQEFELQWPRCNEGDTAEVGYLSGLMAVEYRASSPQCDVPRGTVHHVVLIKSQMALMHEQIQVNLGARDWPNTERKDTE